MRVGVVAAGSVSCPVKSVGTGGVRETTMSYSRLHNFLLI